MKPLYLGMDEYFLGKPPVQLLCMFASWPGKPAPEDISAAQKEAGFDPATFGEPRIYYVRESRHEPGVWKSGWEFTVPPGTTGLDRNSLLRHCRANRDHLRRISQEASRSRYRFNFTSEKWRRQPVRHAIAWVLFRIAFWLIGHKGWYITGGPP